MVNLVYFGAALSREVGDPLPCLRADPSPHWVTQTDLVTMLDDGQEVTIRPATFAEFLRVESTMALEKIERGVCEQMSGSSNLGPRQ